MRTCVHTHIVSKQFEEEYPKPSIGLNSTMRREKYGSRPTLAHAHAKPAHCLARPQGLDVTELVASQVQHSQVEQAGEDLSRELSRVQEPRLAPLFLLPKILSACNVPWKGGQCVRGKAPPAARMPTCSASGSAPPMTGRSKKHS